MIKLLFASSVAILILNSCGPIDSEESLSNENPVASELPIIDEIVSVSINFNNHTGNAIPVFYSNEEELFEPYLDLISDVNAPKYKCGYSGELIYEYKDGSNLSMDFNLQEDCNHIVYIKNDKLISKVLSEKGRTQLLSLMEKGETIMTQIEPSVEPIEPLIDLEKLTVPLMARLKEYDQKDIYEGNGPDETIINHIKFKPNEYSASYLLVQVILKRGEVIQDEFVYYYPDSEGNFIDSQYFVDSDEDRPCEVCNLVSIETPIGKDPIGTFEDRATGKEFTLSMGYNLEEVYFYWLKN